MFRDVKDLKKPLKIDSVPQHKPSVICTGATPSTLLYVNEAKEPRDIYWLDLSDGKPKPAAGKRVIHTRQSYIMCFTRDGDKHLVVVVDHTQGIFAYNADSGKLAWQVCGKLPGMEKYPDAVGVTTDGRGHLFVSDHWDGNDCIQMFSVSDGQYLGCLKKDIIDFSGPGRLYRCEATSLVCSCLTDLKVINIQY